MTAVASPPSRVTLPAEQAIPDLRAIIEDAARNTPRNLQKALGPSDIANACDRCLTQYLAGRKTLDSLAPWLPFIGVAVHEALEQVVYRHMGKTRTDRYIPEGRVTVGQLRGVDITGSSDLFDVHTGTVIDYKTVGKTTLDKVKRHGASQTYRSQIHLYGRGWEAEGFDVTSVAVWFMPRNDINLGAGIVWQEPYSEQVALDALARANQLASFVDTFGADAALEATPPHTGAEFSCGKFPGEQAPLMTPGGDPFAG